jgi:hypothetical protein
MRALNHRTVAILIIITKRLDGPPIFSVAEFGT